MGNLLSGEEEPLDAATEATPPVTTDTPADAQASAPVPAKRKRRATPAVIEVDAYAEPALSDGASLPALPTKDSESLLAAAGAAAFALEAGTAAAAAAAPVSRNDKRFHKTYRKRKSAAMTRKNTGAL